MNRKDQEQNSRPDDTTLKNTDRQGIDKAPDEEPAGNEIENVVANTQKGKNKVDGDPSRETDQPIEQK